MARAEANRSSIVAETELGQSEGLPIAADAETESDGDGGSQHMPRPSKAGLLAEWMVPHRVLAEQAICSGRGAPGPVGWRRGWSPTVS